MKFFPTLIASFHSAALYRSLRHDGHYALGYSFKLVMLATLIVVISGAAMLHRYAFTARGAEPPRFDAAVHEIARQLPTMTLHHGVLKTDKAEATTIHLNIAAPGEEPQPVAIAVIDTTGKTTPTKTDVPIVIDDSNIYITSKEKTEIHPIRQLAENAPETLIINRALIDEQSAQLIAWTHASLGKIYFVFGGITWVLLVIVNYIGRLILLALLAGGACAIASARGKPLGFARAMAVAAVSFTPVAAIDTLSFAATGVGVAVWLLVLGGAVALSVALKIGSAPATLSM